MKYDYSKYSLSNDLPVLYADLFTVKQAMLTGSVQVAPNPVNFCVGVGGMHAAIRV